MATYLKKWYLEKTFEDGRKFEGWINTKHECLKKKDCPNDIKGTFWAMKDKEGFHGQFKLDNPNFSEEDNGFVMGLRMIPKLDSKNFYDELNYYNTPMMEFDKFEDRIENCLNLDKTYVDTLFDGWYYLNKLYDEVDYHCLLKIYDNIKNSIKSLHILKNHFVNENYESMIQFQTSKIIFDAMFFIADLFLNRKLKTKIKTYSNINALYKEFISVPYMHEYFNDEMLIKMRKMFDILTKNTAISSLNANECYELLNEIEIAIYSFVSERFCI